MRENRPFDFLAHYFPLLKITRLSRITTLAGANVALVLVALSKHEVQQARTIPSWASNTHRRQSAIALQSGQKIERCALYFNKLRFMFLSMLTP